ncbi:ABC transporter ATP-binding protein [Paenibacillus mucilaginosus]|uniref:Sulfonate ABC transporter ATP-binding lipoprotein n=2 Tax=Paenibacillus mucilaginosus TaxID=61624 RepID=I0BHD0_9BACL|nr:ABC transporter ATP-binding protein [Paenibacillus mucilaginosus]AEI41027.1 ABC transporter related protein [Paenibacillus mucilaginosus KNP414]AFH61777.1 sulfonate ABC transporter ATP-binding lipoprotein [Paenibacillus mucilaginosus K02]MCG7211530.1 ABC transporter ATP-binding protein [Paenibacillus mucilaginosus]WDM30096.1 ABC transporter ATP-binding protein [Paenibacillus mucilaginosus]
MDRPPNQEAPCISVREVSHRFQDMQALSGISFDIYPGELISLLGPSGCGKSTLLRLMADLLQPTSGEIRVSGGDPRTARLRREFGIVFQHPTLFDWRTVRGNIELPLELLGAGRAERDDTCDALLDLVGLHRFAGHYPWQLSGGMQQRVAIARALSLDPPILFMDEPFSALDEFTKEKLHIELLSIKQATGKTIVFVTHSIPEAAFLSDRIMVLSAHPGRMHSIFDVGLGARRVPEHRDEPQFHELVSRVRACFREEGEPRHERAV